MIAYLFFFQSSIWYIGRSYWVRDGCSAIIFVFSMSKLSSSKFCHSTQSSADALIVALLWKLPQMPSCSTNNANLDKTNFDMFYKIDCCAAIHGQIMTEQCTKLKKTNYAIMRWICFVISVFNFEKFWVKPGFYHAAQTTPTWTKPILTCFTKLIAVQPYMYMAEYEWTMYQIKVD